MTIDPRPQEQQQVYGYGGHGVPVTVHTSQAMYTIYSKGVASFSPQERVPASACSPAATPCASASCSRAC